MELSAAASLSLDMNMAKVQQAASISVMKKALDSQQQSGNAIVQSVQAANPPSQRLNVLA